FLASLFIIFTLNLTFNFNLLSADITQTGSIETQRDREKESNLETPQLACWEAETVCETVGCCGWVKKAVADGMTCETFCANVDNWCANCPSEYKILCDAGCHYKSQCDK